MSLTPEALYLELGSLAAEIPEFTTSPITPETRRWVERAVALVELGGGLADGIQLRVAIENLDGPLRARNAETIASIVRRALAKAELGFRHEPVRQYLDKIVAAFIAHPPAHPPEAYVKNRAAERAFARL